MKNLLISIAFSLMAVFIYALSGCNKEEDIQNNRFDYTVIGGFDGMLIHYLDNGDTIETEMTNTNWEYSGELNGKHKLWLKTQDTTCRCHIVIYKGEEVIDLVGFGEIELLYLDKK